MPIETTEAFRVLRMDEPMYGCEELPEDAPLLCEILLEGPGGRRVVTCPDALLTAAETRTSSPVRITRGEDLQSVSCARLFPCGEGAGYAGGITSSAADGIRAADAVFRMLRG